MLGCVMMMNDPAKKNGPNTVSNTIHGNRKRKKKASLELCTAAAALIVGIAGPNRCTFYECRFEVSLYFSNIKALDNYIETEKCPLQRSGTL
jgi:hypothetical protein